MIFPVYNICFTIKVDIQSDRRDHNLLNYSFYYRFRFHIKKSAVVYLYSVVSRKNIYMTTYFGSLWIKISRFTYFDTISSSIQSSHV